MKITKFTAILFLIISNYTVFAQNSSDKQELPYIEVTGTAENEVVPDEIYIGIVIEEKSIGKTKVAIEEQEERLRKSVTKLGIDLANLSLSNANADYVKVSWQRKDVLTKKAYQLKVSSATIVGRVFQELESIELTDADIVKVSHSKIDSLRKEVKIAAIKAAKEKADYLLKAIGEQTGKALVIREVDSNINPKFRNATAGHAIESNSYAEGIRLEEAQNEIQFQKIKIQSSIYAKFLLK